jgi:hypothetical protein
VVDGTTGILFEEQTVEALNAAVEEMERHVDEFSPSRIQLHARGFDRSVFRRKLEAYLTQAYDAAASR